MERNDIIKFEQGDIYIISGINDRGEFEKTIFMIIEDKQYIRKEDDYRQRCAAVESIVLYDSLGEFVLGSRYSFFISYILAEASAKIGNHKSIKL